MKYLTGIKNKKSRGVTMIELVVVLAIFMIMISVAVTLFISIIQHQRGILYEQEFTNQASYVTEYISRTIRNAKKDILGNCISAGEIYKLTNYDGSLGFYSGIKFLTETNICQQFFMSAGTLNEIKDGGVQQNILSDKFTINYVRFIINGDKTLERAFETDVRQPRVTFVLSVEKLNQPIVQNNLNPFEATDVYAQNNNGIPICGDGICDNWEAIYCSNSCPLFNDCGVCPVAPPSGYSCVNNMCLSDPLGTDSCSPNSLCGDLPITGRSCTNNNNICVSSPNGVDNCTLGLVCGTPPTTGSSCVSGMCVGNSSGINTCVVGSICDTIPPQVYSSQNAIIIQTTVSQKDLIISPTD